MPPAHKLEEKLAKKKASNAVVKCKRFLTLLEENEGKSPGESMDEEEDQEEEIDPSEIELGPKWTDEEL